jgi:succinoglycan biosynthesis transport protein ExoP
MAGTPGAQDIDVSSSWSGVRKALSGLMICTVIPGVVTFAGLGLVTSRCEAETQLTITAKRSTAIVDAKNDASAAASITPRLDREAINTHVRALPAPDLLIKVAKELELERRPEFNAALGPVDTMDRVSVMVCGACRALRSTATARASGFSVGCSMARCSRC